MHKYSKKEIVFATHNLMRGLWLDNLIKYYKALKAKEGLSVLCVQENVIDKGIAHVDKIRKELGEGYRGYFIEKFPSPGIIYDSNILECIDNFSIKLPKQNHYSKIAKMVASEKTPVQRYAVASRLLLPKSEPFTVVSMHLSAFGGNKLRQKQLVAIRQELQKRGMAKRIIICGDTNLFAWTKMMQRRVLNSALKFFNVKDPLGKEPTYYFSRIYKNTRWALRIPHYLGKLGIDLPMHYDLVASEFPFLKYGKITTPESDHDLVWARYDVS